MLENLNNIYLIGFTIWILFLPIAIYQGYQRGIKDYRKCRFCYNSKLIIILPNGMENYIIFLMCCFYLLIYYLISLFVSCILYLFFIKNL